MPGTGGMPGGPTPGGPNFQQSPFVTQLGLPPEIANLFSPREPLPYKKPKEKRTLPAYSGVGAFMALFETEKPEDEEQFNPPLNRAQRSSKKAEDRKAKNKLEIEEGLANWDPSSDSLATGDPLKTLFVGRLSYETTEEKLKKAFDTYGPIKTVRVVKDLQGKSRGYGFVEFENKADMNSAYKFGDGSRIDGREVLCDVELGRVKKDTWRPRRLGGGLGKTRTANKADREPAAKAVPAQEAPRTHDYGSRNYGAPFGSKGGSRFDDRDRRGDRDRGYGGDRDRRGYGGDRDRGYGDRDRGYGGDRDRRGYGDRDRREPRRYDGGDYRRGDRDRR
eukprot:TRINITY_DN8610_c1_g1_i1.p2 TRINITY_DN8610_c1_g1~~TRINITY_DN8610_c1_g1_i1.p2  ORF type:complete len:372 (+),score=92.75 TRINITY_DN8610_c1_g1_i1:117-1118(+)